MYYGYSPSPVALGGGGGTEASVGIPASMGGLGGVPEGSPITGDAPGTTGDTPGKKITNIFKWQDGPVNQKQSIIQIVVYSTCSINLIVLGAGLAKILFPLICWFISNVAVLKIQVNSTGKLED